MIMSRFPIPQFHGIQGDLGDAFMTAEWGTSKLGHCENQIRPLEVETGQYPGTDRIRP